MTIDELIQQLQDARDEYGSCLPVLLLDSKGICSAVECLDAGAHAVLIRSYESLSGEAERLIRKKLTTDKDEDDEDEIVVTQYDVRIGLIKSFIGSRYNQHREPCANTELIKIVVTRLDIIEYKTSDVLKELPIMINKDGYKVHDWFVDFSTDHIKIVLCKEIKI